MHDFDLYEDWAFHSIFENLILSILMTTFLRSSENYVSPTILFETIALYTMS